MRDVNRRSYIDAAARLLALAYHLEGLDWEAEEAAERAEAFGSRWPAKATLTRPRLSSPAPNRHGREARRCSLTA